MSPAEQPLSILLINEHADEVKLMTIALRGFFPGCRIESAYSAEEALDLASKGDWQLILIDEQITGRTGVDLLADFRRLAPYAALILQTQQSDSSIALEALRNGADFLLFKSSPAFLTELMFFAREALEKRDLQVRLDRTFERHLRLVEALHDVMYELDRDGRFVYVSAGITELLGYTPDDLLGVHYSTIVAPEHASVAKYRFNDRRAGTRSARHTALTLVGKPSEASTRRAVAVDLNAKAVYDSHHHYVGTVGLLRDQSLDFEQRRQIQHLESQLRQTTHQLGLSQQVTLAARALDQPLATLLQNSTQLLSTLRSLQVEGQLESLTTFARRARELTSELHHAVLEQHPGQTLVSLHERIEHAIVTLQREGLLSESGVRRAYTPDLQLVAADPDDLGHLARILLSYALQDLTLMPLPGTVSIHTRVITSSDAEPTETEQSGKTHAPALPPPYVVVTIERLLDQRSDQGLQPSPRATVSTSDILLAQQIVRRYQGAIEIHTSPQRPLVVSVSLPITDRGAPPFPTNHRTTQTRDGQPSPITNEPVPSPLPSRGPARKIADRRRTERVSLTLPVRLTLNDRAYEGLTQNIGTGGVLAVFTRPFPRFERHPVHVVAVTAESALELHGIATYRPASLLEQAASAPSHVVLEFSVLPATQQAVFSSLVLGARERSIELRLDVLVTDVQPPPETTESRADRWGARATEPRAHVRAYLSLPVRVELPLAIDTPARLVGMIENLSYGGAMIRGRFPALRSGSRILVHLSVVASGDTGSEASHQTLQDCTLPARIAWTEPDHRERQASHAWRGEATQRIGLQFQQLSAPADDTLVRLITPCLLAQLRLAETDEPEEIITHRHERRNVHGFRLAISEDVRRLGVNETTPVIILSPGYSRTKAAYLSLSYYLAAHGLRVLRYDHSNHVGLSDGAADQWTLGGMGTDLETLVAVAKEQWPAAPLGVLAWDLAARAAISVAARRADPDLLILINPLLDLHHALLVTTHHDLASEFSAGTRRGVANLFGLNVHLDHVLESAVTMKHLHFSSTLAELQRLRASVVMFVQPEDVPQREQTRSPLADQLTQVRSLLGSRLTIVPMETPIPRCAPFTIDLGEASYPDVLVHCERTLRLSHTPAVAHEQRAILPRLQSRLESDQLHGRHHVSQVGRASLRLAHLSCSAHLTEVSQYWQHLDGLYQLMGPLDGRMSILDVGCGHGELARSLLLNRSYRLFHTTWKIDQSLRYVGIEDSVYSLHVANQAYGTLHQELDASFSGSVSARQPVRATWVLGDFNDQLPFTDGCFDHVVCHLTLTFARHPLSVLRQLGNLLRPGGQLLVACFTPTSDLSVIYRAHLSKKGLDEFSPDARAVLQYLGKLREGLATTRLHGFRPEQLRDLIASATNLSPRTIDSLDGQIVVASAQKPVSSS